jgi:hypothetical protein
MKNTEYLTFEIDALLLPMALTRLVMDLLDI